MKRCVLTAIAVMFGAFAVYAQDWPTKTVKIIVPFAAGATPDLVARLVADQLQDKLGQTFIVENKPGASGNTGTDAVAKAAPDGSTIGVSIGGPLAINTLLFSKLPYDPRPHMRSAGRGAIVNVSSISGHVGMPASPRRRTPPASSGCPG